MGKQKKPERVKRPSLVIEEERARRFDAYLSVCLVNIDGLSIVNETIGKEAGDFLVSEIASIIRKNIRKIDIMGRWPPDDYIILTVDRNAFGALALAQKIREIVASSCFTYKDKEVRATISVGVAIARPQSTDALDELIETAKRALVKAKASGRNRVEILSTPTSNLPATLNR
jgi:diguanylate cyclase